MSKPLNSSVKPKVVKSSLLQAYSYDAETYKLTVTFNDGTEKVYKDVDPPTLSKVFDSPGSIGSKFKRFIGSLKQGVEEQE